MVISREYKESHGLTPDRIADTMIGFYEKVDAACLGLTKSLEQHGIRLNCRRGCCHCCQDGLTMSQAEASVIRRLFPDISREVPHEKGACPFLDEAGSCRIYAARPYICRTHGLPIQWTERDGEDEVRQRAICDLNEGCLDILSVPEDLCWNADVAETQLAILNLYTFDTADRIPMRAFFE